MSKTKDLFMEQRQWEEDNLPTHPMVTDYLDSDYQYKNYLKTKKKKDGKTKPSRLPK